MRIDRRMRNFHLRMAASCAVLALISVVGCRLSSIHTDVVSRAIAVAAVVGMTIALPAYWHDKKRPTLRDSALTLPWAAAIAALLPFPLLIAARLRMPLEDGRFARIDEALGVHAPAIVGWASSHWLGELLNWSYGLLIVLLLAAVFLPALTGKLASAREFLDANLIAFAISIPIFALLPAIGPWVPYHFTPAADQLFCQDQLLHLRLSDPYMFVSQGAGIVCLPSFHVIWAVLCARALWGFRLLRIPAAVVSAMILISTITTGWHYLVDVIAGVAVAAVSLLLARCFEPAASSVASIGVEDEATVRQSA